MKVLELKETDAHTKNVCFLLSFDSTRQKSLSTYTAGWIKVWLSVKKHFPLTTTLTASTCRSPSPHKKHAGSGRQRFPDQPALLSQPRSGKRNDILPRTDVLEWALLAGQARMWSFWIISKHSGTAWLAEKINTLCLAGIISSPAWGSNVIVSL